MLADKRVLVVVPARGGSKGIPLKNLAKVCGQTLIWHTAQIVKALDFVDRAVVSTDNPAIAMVAADLDLNVLMRPAELSGDLVGDHPVLLHALTEMERQYGVTYDVVVMLQPTCPLRTPEHVTATVKKLIQEQFDSVWTVSPVPLRYHPLKQLRWAETLRHYVPRGRSIVARQQLDETYYRNGAAYAFTRECLLYQGSTLGTYAGYVVIHEPLVSIDTPDDLAEVERIRYGIGRAPGLD